MTKGEFEQALDTLYRNSEIYEPAPGRIEATYGHHRYSASGDIKGKAVKVKFPKPKVLKSKVKLIKRKYVEGYQCGACGKWFRRDWTQRRLTTCPKCGKRETLKAAYYDKRSAKLEKQLKGYDVKISNASTVIRDLKDQLSRAEHDGVTRELEREANGKIKKAAAKVDKLSRIRTGLQKQWERLESKHLLKKAYKKYQRTTKHYKTLLKYVEPTRVGKPGLTVAKWPPPPPKPMAVAEIEKKKPKHRKRAEYTGSSEATSAGKKSWETRHKHGWKPKETPVKPKTLTGNVKLSKTKIAGYKSWASRRGRVLIGFYRDESGEVRPITKSLREVNRQRVVKQPRRFRDIKPKKKWSLPPRVIRPKPSAIDVKNKTRKKKLKQKRGKAIKH
jgi:predicted  nucleic acid-binding Zn-ribbon protein